MVKKYISGENLMYVLSMFEKQMIQIVEERVNIIKANDEDLKNIFVKNP
jgi:hypothetical protein